MPEYIVSLAVTNESPAHAAPLTWRCSYEAEAASKWAAIDDAKARFGREYRVEAVELKSHADTAPFFHWNKPELLKKCCALEKDLHHARLRGFATAEELAAAYDQLLTAKSQ